MLLLCPFLLPLMTAVLCTCLKGRRQIHISIFSSLLLFTCVAVLLQEVVKEGRQSLTLGNWPLPYGIEFAADGLSAAMLLLIALVNLIVFIYQAGWRELPDYQRLFPLLHGLIAGCMATILAADLFNLYVWLELVFITMLGLLTLGGGKRNNEAAFKYFCLNMPATLLLLSAIALIYGATGHLNIEAIAMFNNTTAVIPTAFVAMLLAALLLKAGIFPLYSWLPASYHTLPVPILALVGGLLTKLMVYLLIRLTGQIIDIGQLSVVLGWLAIITILSGVLGAAYHWDLRRILAFHIISQIGYLLLGVALHSPESFTATFFFLFHNVLVKTNLLLLSGLMWFSMGHYDLRKGGGLFRKHPTLAVLFLFNALALVGVPPTSGFWGKFMILKETFRQGDFLWGGIALGAGLLTLYSMSKIWINGFWKPHAEGSQTSQLPVPSYYAVISLSVVILLIGLYPEPLIQFLGGHCALLLEGY